MTKPTDDRFRLVDQQGKWRLLTVPPTGNRRDECPASGPNTPTASPAATTDGTRPVEVIGR